MNLNDRARIRANWMDRSQLESVLHNASIDTDDDESTDDLRNAVVENVNDGTIDIDELPETDAEDRIERRYR